MDGKDLNMSIVAVYVFALKLGTRGGRGWGPQSGGGKTLILQKKIRQVLYNKN